MPNKVSELKSMIKAHDLIDNALRYLVDKEYDSGHALDYTVINKTGMDVWTMEVNNESNGGFFKTTFDEIQEALDYVNEHKDWYNQ